MTCRLSVVFVALLCLGFVSMPGAGAQETSPVPEEIALPLAPDPSRCTVEPRSRSELETLYAEVNPTGEEIAPEITPPAVPADAAEADEATKQAIIAASVQIIACAANGNRGLQDASLVTEAHLRYNLMEFARADFDSYYTETPESSPPENWIIIYAIRDIRMLDDGRVICHPDIIVPGVGRFLDTVVFANVDGRWLIDGSFGSDTNVYPGEPPMAP